MNTNFKDDFVEYKCLCCKKNYQQKFDEKSKEQFFNTYKFSNQDNNKFILLLGKGFYPYEYMVDLEKKKEKIRKIMFIQIMRTQKEFVKIKTLERYVYVQSTTL